MQRLSITTVVMILMSIWGYSFAQDLRLSRSLNADWRFQKGDHNQAIKPNFDDKDWQRIDLPHTWNAQDMLDDEPGYYRGLACYRKHFRVSKAFEGQKLYLYFEAANQDAFIYLNGKEVGTHYGGYTAFCLDITDVVRFGEDNVLVLRLDNRFNDAVPPLGGDFGHFGGIYRSVHLLITKPIHFDMLNHGSSGVFFTTPNISKGSGEVKIWGGLRNESAEKCQLTITHQVLDANRQVVAEVSENHKVKTGESLTFEQQTPPVASPELWSPDNPYLYQVRSVISDQKSGEVYDELYQDLGFRWVSAHPDSGFFLNGKHFFIKGIGKHQDYDQLGYAVPEEVLVRDVELSKAMGANLLRAHYPLAKVHYQTCDRLGMLNWVRLPVMDKIALTDTFKHHTFRMMKELMLQNYNHPSAVVWSSMCEPFGDMDWYWPQPKPQDKIQANLKGTYEFAVALDEFTKKLDNTRLTTMSFHTDPTPEWYKESKLTDVHDINGWNIYQGWYHVNLDNVGPALDTFRAYNPQKPYVLTEFGAGSDPRIHSYEPTIFDFSIEYQNLFHARYLAEVEKRPWIGGMCIWTLFDFQVEGRRDAVPHINSKGVLTVDRQTKDVYYLYQAHWSDRPVLHIAAKDWTTRIEAFDSEGYATRPIAVFSNQKQVELLLNGQSLGVKQPEDCIASWQVPFGEGNNQLVARVPKKAELIDKLDFRIHRLPTDLFKGDLPVNPMCINVGQALTYVHDPVIDKWWLPDQAYDSQTFGHKTGNYYQHWPNMAAWEGIRYGIDHDIYGTDLDPVYQSFLLGVTDYQVDLQPGTYRVTLCFAEPFTLEQRKDAALGTGCDANGEREFDILLNGKLMLEGLNLARDYGVYQSVSEAYLVDVGADGLTIALKAKKGQTVLNGIKILQLH